MSDGGLQILIRRSNVRARGRGHDMALVSSVDVQAHSYRCVSCRLGFTAGSRKGRSMLLADAALLVACPGIAIAT